jgi:hypothetical protein
VAILSSKYLTQLQLLLDSHMISTASARSLQTTNTASEAMCRLMLLETATFAPDLPRFIVLAGASLLADFARESRSDRQRRQAQSRDPCVDSTIQQFVLSNKLSKARQQMHSVSLDKVSNFLSCC